MFGVTVNIIISQVSTTQYPDRKKIFNFNFLTSGNGVLTWNHLTDTFNVVLPRSIYFIDESTGQKVSWKDEPIYGNPEKSPLVMRGDKISISLGYSYFKPTQQDSFDRSQTVNETLERFNGYIVRIKNKTPMEFECEDNMFA